MRDDPLERVRTLEDFDHLDWELWLLSFLVILVLLIAWILNHNPGFVAAVPDVLKPRELEVYVDGLSVLVLLFCLYVIQKHHQLMAARNDLVRNHVEQAGLERRLSLIECLLEVSTSVDEIAEAGGPWDDVLQRLLVEFEADRILLWRLEEGAEELQLEAAAGETAPPAGECTPLGRGFAGWVATHGEPLLLDHPIDETAFSGLTVTDRGTRSTLYVPMRVEGEIRGVLGVDVFGGERRFNQVDQKLLQTFSNNLAYAIARGLLIQQLRDSLQMVAETQMHLIQAEKLAGLGELMAGISHELNNPLSVVVGHSELLLRDEGIEEALRERLEKMASEGIRAKRLVENLLRVARGEEGNREPADLNEVIFQAIRLLRYQLDLEGIESELELAEDLPPTVIDRFQIQQLIFNLANNARQAMQTTPAGERQLCLRTSLVEEGVPGLDGGPAIVLEVADSGPGIEPSRITRVFDPFYTTRQTSGGTGLGLSIAFRTMQEHGGAIAVENDPKGGAVFRVWFPVGEDVPALGPEPIVEEAPAPNSAPGIVMVVDDEERVREVLDEVFSLLGHQVRSASHGAEALERLEEDAVVDAIILDLKMPVMDGQEFFARLQEHHPGLVGRVLFLTGDTLSDRARTFLESAGRPHMSKPFTVNELREQVEELMKEAS